MQFRPESLPFQLSPFRTSSPKRRSGEERCFTMSPTQEMGSVLPISSADTHESHAKAWSNGVAADGSWSSTPQSDQVPQMERIMPIAIVGMSCRFPGNSSNPERLWKMISQSRSGWSNVPKDRFKQTSFYHPKRGMEGTVSPTLLASFTSQRYVLTETCSSMHKGPTSSARMSPHSTHLFSISPQKRPR